MNGAIRAIRSGSAHVRVAAVREFLHACPPDAEVLLVAASRGAADDCARMVAADRGVLFGLHRFSVIQLAAWLAAGDLAARNRTPITRLGFEALAARASFEAVQDGTLGYLRRVHGTPGFPRALAATLTELRLRTASPAALSPLDRSGSDLADLLNRVEAWMDGARATDRAAFVAAAIARLRDTRDGAGLPIVLLDVPFDSVLTIELLLTLIARASSAIVTVPAGDEAAAGALEGAGIAVEDRHPASDNDLARLHRHLFAEDPPGARERTGEMIWMSAPGEARECVEIARRVLDEAAAGVPFDDMAVFLRSPPQYAGLLEHAFARARVPAHFDRGTRRPDPAGRALLALLACAAEGLSARRFAEYLSLAQVPTDHQDPALDTWTVADDEAIGQILADAGANPDPAAEGPAAADHAPRISAPWRWERLLVDASVIGGADRWERRLEGLRGELAVRIEGLRDEDPDHPRIDRLTRELGDVHDLQTFALPLIREMGAWPDRARWGEWIAALDPFAARVLRQPARVQQVLASFRPMSDVGPVTLAEVCRVLTDPLSALSESPASPRYGRVFVAGLDEARGRTFRIVFVPGLAERVFPRVIHEDPLFVDDLRSRVGGLVQQDGRAALERLGLRLAVGAASSRVYASFPRMDATGGRERVPSFYALEIIRAVTGRVPDSARLKTQAAEASDAALAWPSPPNPADAIDDFEHDLAVLRHLMARGRTARGQAHYIVQLNPHLRRSLTAQWQRARAVWTPSDGLVRAGGEVRALLDTQRLHARPYSVSALQHYAACPYRFLLSAVYRLAPVEEPAALQRLDPLTRGSLFHRVQSELFRALAAESLLPPRPADQARIRRLLDATIARVEAEFAERLAPAIDRVWRDEIAAIARDLYVWIDRVMHDLEWTPWRFELAFGLTESEGRDDHSQRDPVTIDGRFLLRGAIDLVEERRGSAGLRVTDYKTSRNRLQRQAVVAGGAVLQPVLYSLAVEAATERPVESARLWYCTSTGGFSEHTVAMSDAIRRQGRDVLAIVDRAIELGVFPAAPRDQACAGCDFRRACGPDEERRTRHKSRDLLGDVHALREMT
jgi:CRISPR/Cas system-associated exonuclease Cas4 (RecB family)